MDSAIRVVATFFGTGRFPFAPATFASLVFAVAMYLLPAPSSEMWIAITLVVIAVGIWVSHRAEAYYGHDGSPIVIDEVAGMLVTLWAMPRDPWWVWVAGFFLFRFFDIAKPFPAGRAQELPGGWGVMLDDVAAGVYAHLVLRLLLVWVG